MPEDETTLTIGADGKHEGCGRICVREACTSDCAEYRAKLPGQRQFAGTVEDTNFKWFVVKIRPFKRQMQ